MTEVKDRVMALRGEEGRMAMAKFVAACVIRGDEKTVQGIKEMDMLIDEVKDNPIAQRFIEIAGKEKLEEKERHGITLGLARAVVNHAVCSDMALPYSQSETETMLASYADDDMLLSMIESLASMDDFAEFVKSHGVKVPGFTS